MSTTRAGPVVRRVVGRYLMFFQGVECGEERWTIEQGSDGLVVNGELEIEPPHPFPSRHEYRATLTSQWRIIGLEIRWTVGDRVVQALHRAEGGQWRARIEVQGQVKEQQGDFPEFCEVDYATHLFSSFLLARRDFAVGGEHEFPALRIGPPFMAVTPERMLYRCVETGFRATPLGVRAVKRYVVSLPGRPEREGYTFWADEDGWVVESFDDVQQSRPWMRLVELMREEA
jgi:hypothetical protein